MAKLSKITSIALLSSLVGIAQAAVPLDTPSMTPAQQKLLDKKVNIEWNVLPTVIGYFSASAEYKFMPAMAVGAYGGIGTWNTKNTTMYNFGAQFSYAVNGNYMSTGWLIKPFVGYSYYKKNNSKATSGVNAGVLASHQWMWDSGFNLQLGIGPAYAAVKSGAAKIKGLYPAVEFNLGYAI